MRSQVIARGKSARRGAVALLALALLTGCGHYRTDQLPAQPTDLRASDGTYAGQVVVVWAEVDRAERYEISRARSEAGDYEKVGDSLHGLYVDRMVDHAHPYWYRVRACGPGGCSEHSQPASGYTISEGPDLPLPPMRVRATDGAYQDQITITWEPAVDVTEYIVHRAQQRDGPYQEIARTDATSYNDERVDAGVVYWYRVQSADEAGRRSMNSALAEGWAI